MFKKKVVGILLVSVGLIGCLFPIMPGIPMVIAGAALILGLVPKNNAIYRKLFGEDEGPTPDAPAE